MGRKGRKHPGDDRVLDVVSVGQIPLREVSGLALARLDDQIHLAAVGDHGPDVGLARLDGVDIGEWRVIDLSDLPLPPGAPEVEQAEAIATDGAHQALVLIEDPALLLVLDTRNPRLTHFYALVLDAQHDVPWAEDPASRGEGMVLMRDGHVLIVKEKRPAGLLEFGPADDPPLGVSSETLHRDGDVWAPPTGDTLHALAWWPVDATLADLSDAAIGPDGALYLLSDQSNAVARLRIPLAPGMTPVYEAVWALSASIDKAEGLTFLPDGSALVAVDRSSVGDNLFTLPPVTEWSAPR